MKRIGFPVNHKENEKRRALLPDHLRELKNPGNCYFQEGFGNPLGISDREYREAGGKIVGREEALSMEIICSPKSLDDDMTECLKQGQTLFGWVHAVQNKRVTDILIERKMTAVAWGEMFEGGVHVYRRNNEIAGEGAVIHASCFCGILPSEWRVALLGLGNCGKGAYHALEGLGAEITVYHRDRIFHLKDEIESYNVVVNTLLWDMFEERVVLSRDDVRRMEEGSMIIDVSCDAEGMCLDTTHPTTISDPVYLEEGVIHYAVDHVPAIFYKSASRSISSETARYLDFLSRGEHNQTLEDATVIKDGEILDQRIIRFQKR